MAELRVGFVGLGAMGGPMAGHLHRAGLLVAVGNRSPCESAGVRGRARRCSRGDACGTGAAVRRDRVVRQRRCRCARRAHIAAHAKPGTVVIDHSTVSPETAKQAHKLMLDAGR
jgi:3-hydroxyisobutyrate dehydrogenase